MPASFDPKPRWERRKDARPQEILSAALDLFVERGFAATRVDDVAKQAGLSKGTLYLYFANKEELFKAVVRENIVPTLNAAQATVAHFEGSSADLFRLLITNWWQHIGDGKASGISKLMMAEAANFPDLARFYHEEVIVRSDLLMTSVLERGIARKEFRAVNDLNTVRVLVAPILMLMMWKHSFGPCQITPIDNHAYLARFIDLCLNGLVDRNEP